MVSFTPWIRHCAVCGNSFPPILWLCSSCFRYLKTFYLPPHIMLRIQSKFHHLRLIDWTNKNDHFIRQLIKSLKGNQRSPFFKILAHEFCTRLLHIKAIQPLSNASLVPCPARTKTSFFHRLLNIPEPDLKDHGFYWGQSIHEQINFPLYNILKASPNSEFQKRKTLLERKNKVFQITSNVPKDKTVIFTDDIVTSGATAYAAYRALLKPQTFMIWSIFWRKF